MNRVAARLEPIEGRVLRRQSRDHAARCSLFPMPPHAYCAAATRVQLLRCGLFGEIGVPLYPLRLPWQAVCLEPGELDSNTGGHRMHSRRPSLTPAPRLEPPLDGDRPGRPRSEALSPRAALPCHRRMPSHSGSTSRAAERRARHDGRSPSYGRDGETGSAASRFAESSLRLVLEVLDGRRPAVQLRRLASPSVLAAIETLARSAPPGRKLGPATLTKLGVELTGPNTAEVYGRYQRGNREFAVAACVVLHRAGWQLTAFRVL
ncbi:Rv3235 family protein [Nocardia sp. CS682]|uniref:Rv3235 family protein n=1 Tax=Nocardia sp. CS682 TaxID=1047172 RepID=UPI00351A722A